MKQSDPYEAPSWTRLSIKKAITILVVILVSGVVIGFCYHDEQEAKKRAQIEEKQYYERSYAPKFQPDSLEWIN